MDYTFVPQYNGDGPRKRRLARACEACRARKKRCYHNATEDAGSNESMQDNDAAPITKRSDSYQGISVRKGKSNRFLSDLSPETRLLERTTANGEHGFAKSLDSVGIWVNRTEYESLVRERNAARGVGFRSDGSELINQPVNLSKPQVEALVEVYFRKIHPLLPVIEEEEFRSAYSADTIPEAYLHALCLVAAKDHEAIQHLNTNNDADWSPRQLCRSLQASVKTAITTSLRHDKITLICVLALLSLHNEGSDGAEEASLYLVQAMHHCQSLGLHLSASFPARDGKHTKRLFWCLWILDRFSAAMNGRPIMMADNDVAIEHFQQAESGFPAFDILLKITGILNEVIGYYRPDNPPTTTGWETKFPGFEEIVDAVAGWGLSGSLLSTLRIAYLTVTILSHRSKGVAAFASTTPSYLRQSLSAIQIIRLMDTARLPGLHAIPILPYAISLALSVSYQHLRQDQLIHQQEDARVDFEACYVILRELKKTWSSADAMSTLSGKVVEELKRVPNITAFKIKRSGQQDKELEGFTTACKHDNEPVTFSNGPATTAADPIQQLYTPTVTEKDNLITGSGLFEGIDDIFGTYLDPNYPVNLDFLDDIENLDTTEWHANAP